MFKSLLIILGSFLLASGAFSAAAPANSLHYRSGTELLTENSKAMELQGQIFSKSSSFDEQGSELVQADDEKFSVSDWTLKYSQGLFPDFEASLFARTRSVKSETASTTSSNSGLQSIGVEGKYLFFAAPHFKHVLGLRFKKAMYTNTRYTSPEIPPSTEIVLGDDGNEMGVDYFVTYFDKYLKYDFRFGYNKPSSDLSDEVLYNVEIIYDMGRASFLAGLSGIHSLKKDAYTEMPTAKPAISNGSSSSRLFNSINREKNSLYAGVQYAIGSFVIGIKGETVISGSSTDKGNTVAFNIRWENNKAPSKDAFLTSKIFKTEYLAQGFVEKISASGKMIKINIGTNNQLVIGSDIDVFSINDYSKGHEMAKGVVVQIGPAWSIVKLIKIFNQSPIQAGDLIRAY